MLYNNNAIIEQRNERFAIKQKITSFIDFFYPLFRRLMPLKTFRYAVCGGFSTSLDIFIYFIGYNFILQKKILYLPGLVAISPHIAALILSFCISFPIGFWLNKSIVFHESPLRGRVQFIRYFLVVIGCILLNYIFIKLFVEHFYWYPTPSKMATTVIVVVFSYIMQRNFTFKHKKV